MPIHVTQCKMAAGTDYNDAITFDPLVYLQRLHLIPEGSGNHRDLNKLWLEIFTNDGVRGDRLLDFGSGPSIHIAIAASYSFNEVYLSDYAPQNRQALRDWVDRKLPHDWTPFFKMAAEHEGSGITWQEIEDRVRSKVKKIIHCDVHEENILELDEPTTFDCITTCLCLGVCKDHETYQSVLHKFASFLRDEGFLIIGGVYGQSFYRFGGRVFKKLQITEEMLQVFLERAGFEIVVQRQFPRKVADPTNTNFDGVFFFVKAQKKRKT